MHKKEEMVELAKIETKRMYQTPDGEKFDTIEDAQLHLKILQFRQMIGIKIKKK